MTRQEHDSLILIDSSPAYIKFVLKHKVAIDFLSKFYGGSFIAFPDDNVDAEVKRALQLMHVQKTYLLAFVARHLRPVDRYIMLRFDKFAKRKITQRIFVWWFKNKVQFIPFKVSFKLTGPGLMYEKVRIYKQEHTLTLPFFNVTVEDLIEKVNLK